MVQGLLGGEDTNENVKVYGPAQNLQIKHELFGTDVIFRCGWGCSVKRILTSLSYQINVGAP